MEIDETISQRLQFVLDQLRASAGDSGGGPLVYWDEEQRTEPKEAASGSKGNLTPPGLASRSLTEVVQSISLSVPAGEHSTVDGGVATVRPADGVPSALQELTVAIRDQLTGLAANTEAIHENTQSVTARVMSTALRSVQSGSGLLGGLTGGLGSMFGLIGSLFSRRADERETPEAMFKLPPAVRMETPVTAQVQETGRRQTAERASSEAAIPVAPITIQVQAIDSKSFLDHSDAIASALREAMLRSHTVNDLFNEI